MLILAG